MELEQLLYEQQDLWHGGQSKDDSAAVLATGFDALDELVGGWPRGDLSEIHCDAEGLACLNLVIPLLARLSVESRWIAWIAPPAIPDALALQAWGVDLSRVLLVHPPDSAGKLWALEQALASGTCSAVLAWPETLSLLQGQQLRRAAQQGDAVGLLFQSQQRVAHSSAAALRLQVHPRADGMRLELLNLPDGGGLASLHITL
ncbi:translesion DNA synthesis-associated protein ImuA [endosymbiont of Riftia pachyptila]|nr:translesion DNA synthesis-associated protein ImuA [endosymbiont of Riftia pachyptila]